jgi:hypothetical protein
VAIVQRLANDPSERSQDLQKRLASYRSIAKWNEPERSIYPLSENTLRKYLVSEHPKGCAGFEEDRRLALGLTEEKAKREKATYQILVNYLGEYNARYLDLLKRVLHLRSSDNRVNDACQAHLRLYPLEDFPEVTLEHREK